MSYETLLIELRGRVALVRLNRPKQLNALNKQLIHELVTALEVLDGDAEVGAIVLTGSDKAFAAGADIKEMSTLTFADAYLGDHITEIDGISRIRKPIIAAVAGYALGGGCELAMLCDFILAADTAKFGQPEITLGVIPGAGGSQRLTRLVGKSKAMDMVLTGRMMDAVEAERAGLVSRIIPAADLVDEAVKIATKIANFSLPALVAGKEVVNQALETTLVEGVRYERRLFHALFATEDQKEGMNAFVEKRPAVFKHR